MSEDKVEIDPFITVESLSLRLLIIKKLDEIKTRECNFSKELMRWRRCQFEDKHISEVDYVELNDEDLFNFYNRVTRAYSIAM